MRIDNLKGQIDDIAPRLQQSGMSPVAKGWIAQGLFCLCLLIVVIAGYPGTAPTPACPAPAATLPTPNHERVRT
jgi:hypothetical protein